MKAKTILILSALLLFGVTGCKKEKADGSGASSGVPTYLNVAIKLDSPSGYGATRADQNTLNYEQKINTLKVYVFGGGVLESASDVTLNAGNVGTTYFDAKTGPKVIYAIANARPDMIFALGTPLSVFRTKAVSALNADIALRDAFVMIGGSQVDLRKQTQAEALSNPIPITVARAAAKVQVKFNPSTIIISPAVAGSFTSPGYTLVQTNTTMFVPRTGYELSPNGQDMEQRDANGDGMYDHLLARGAVGDVAAGLEWSTAYPALYMPENVNENPSAGNTSYVLLTFHYTPDPSVIKGTNTTLQGGTFYTVKVGQTTDIYADHAQAQAAATTAGPDAILKTYESGLCHYRIDIRDSRSMGSKTEIYSVIRNSFYKINITEIKAIGGSTPTDPDVIKPIDPETPIEENTLISTSILIEPWNSIIIDEPLGL